MTACYLCGVPTEEAELRKEPAADIWLCEYCWDLWTEASEEVADDRDDTTH